MKNILLILLLLPQLLLSQSKQDYNWVLGYNYDTTTPEIEGMVMNFDVNERTVDTANIGTNSLWFNNASISDTDGNLLLYTNACYIYDGNHQLVENGDSINHNEWFDMFCNGHGSGNQNTMILPDPGSSSGFYILHQPLNFYENPLDFQSSQFRYTYVEHDASTQTFAVTVKDTAYYDKGYQLSSAFFHAIMHENGRDWWFIKNKYNSNTKFIFGINPSGIFLQDSVAIGDTIDGNTSGGNQARFSPSGDQYISHSYKYGLNTYDFDRSTGALSNHDAFFIKEPQFQQSSLEISPSGQFAYVIFYNEVYQTDLWADDPESTTILVGTYDGFADPIPSTFNIAQLAPDCKIYISSGSTTRYIHIIHRPDEPGLDCNFVQRSLILPRRNSGSSLPNNPQFRIDEQDICDPTITNVFGLPVIMQNKVSIWPNPARHTISTDGLEGAVRVYDYVGQLVLEDDDATSVSISDLSPGVYLIQDARGATGRFVVMRE